MKIIEAKRKIKSAKFELESITGNLNRKQKKGEFPLESKVFLNAKLKNEAKKEAIIKLAEAKKACDELYLYDLLKQALSLSRDLNSVLELKEVYEAGYKDVPEWIAATRNAELIDVDKKDFEAKKAKDLPKLGTKVANLKKRIMELSKEIHEVTSTFTSDVK